MNAIMPFDFENNAIRVVLDEQNAPWFNANDLCQAMGYVNPRKALDDHVDEEEISLFYPSMTDVTKRDPLPRGHTQPTKHVNESGLYALIFGSTKEEAKRFKRWVTSEVLPAIRKTGRFETPVANQPTTTEQWEVIRRAVVDLVDKRLDRFANSHRSVEIITGSLRTLIFGSTKEEAKRFKRWVTSEVLPAIRKTGRFETPVANQPTTTEQWEVIRRAVVDLVDKRLDRFANSHRSVEIITGSLRTLVDQRIDQHLEQMPQINPQALRTRDEARAAIALSGKTLSGWAREHGYGPSEVRKVLCGQVKGLSGKASIIAHALGIIVPPRALIKYRPRQRKANPTDEP